MALKNVFKLGLMLAVPVFLLVFLVQIIVQTFAVLYPILDFIHLPIWLYKPASAVLAILISGIAGFVLTRKLTDKVLSHTPLLNILWKRIKAIVDRLDFIMQGGYKVVMYTGYHKDTLRERPGIVLGKLRREYSDGTARNLLIVMQPIPNVFDSLLVPVEDTEVVEEETNKILLYMATGGIISPPVIKTRHWTSAEYKDVPGVSDNDNYQKT